MKLNNNTKKLWIADIIFYWLFLDFLFLMIFFTARANIMADSVDYYTILQRLTDNSKKPVVDNIHFVEQRSPGYSIISVLPYYFASLGIEPFVETEEIINERQKLSGPPNGRKMEGMGIPGVPLLAKNIFFKNFYLERSGGWFEWKIIFALLFTSYALLFTGFMFIKKTLSLENKNIPLFSLIPVTVVTSSVFMQSILATPAYATLTAFGLSSLFCYFFINSNLNKRTSTQFLAGLFLGLLVLTRFETVVIFGVVFLFLLLSNKDMKFIKNLLLGASVSLVLLLIYNVTQFGNILHLGILKGDINVLSVNYSYMFANIFDPKSGIVFWSPFVSLGIISLLFSQKKYLKILGICSIVLICLLLFRVPVMYNCIGQEQMNIGGLPVACPRNTDEALMLVRSDINRYIVVLIPFVIVGLQSLIARILKNQDKR